MRRIEAAWGSWLEARGVCWALTLPLAYLVGRISLLLRSGRPQRVAGIRVVSVGNLSLGGAGKTPLVQHSASFLIRQGKRVGIATRGYHGGDEAQMLRQALPGARVFVGSDRLSLARQAVAEGCQFLLLDDGFQRRHQLARDLDILVLDWTRRRQDGYCLPAGRLREPLAGAAEADAVVVTHAPEAWNAAALRAGLPGPYRGLKVFRGDHVPLRLKRLQSAGAEPLSFLKGRELCALSAIGNPEAFEAQLRALGAQVRPRRFSDHHVFQALDLAGLKGLVVCTAKDAVKLQAMALPTGTTWLALEMDLRVSPAKEFEELLLQ